MTEPMPEIAPGATIDTLVDALERHTARVETLEGELARLRDARRDIMTAIAPLMRHLNAPQRRMVEFSIAAAEKRAGASRGKVGATRLTRAALDFLALSEHDEIRAVELTWYLRRMGFSVAPQYAGTLLKDWTARNVVGKSARGVYRINKVHPEVVKIRLGEIDRRMVGG